MAVSMILSKICAFYKNDGEGGIGFYFERDTPGIDLDKIASIITSAMVDYDEAAKSEGDDVFSSKLIEQLVEFGRINDLQDKMIAVAMVNIHWLESRGHLAVDDYNGMVFEYRKDSSGLLSERAG
jgi:hypothetical protein